jgi:hypothetical protein
VISVTWRPKPVRDIELRHDRCILAAPPRLRRMRPADAGQRLAVGVAAPGHRHDDRPDQLAAAAALAYADELVGMPNRTPAAVFQPWLPA